MNEEKLFDAYLRNELSEHDSLAMIDKISTDEAFSDRLTEYIYSTNLIIKNATASGELSQKKTKNLKVVKYKKKQVGKPLLSTAIKFASAAFLIVGFVLLFVLNKPSCNTFKLNAYYSSKEIYHIGYSPSEVPNKLEDGEVLEYSNSRGTKVLIEGPAIYQLENDNQIYLESGKAYVSLTENAQSFVLKTPYGVARDLGTAFGSEVREGEMDLHVFDGIVEFGPQKLKAYKDDAYSLKANLIQKIKFNPDKFLTKVPEYHEEKKINLLSGEVLDLPINRQIDSLKIQILPISIKADHGSFEFKVTSGSKVLKKVNLVGLKGSQTLVLKDLSKLNALSFTVESYRNRAVDESVGSVDVKLYDFPIEIPEILISNKDNWHYYKSTLAPNSDWYKMKKTPSDWLKGQSPIGFGIEVNTELKKTPAPLYVYKEFTVDVVPENGVLLLNHSFDDGGIVYLNGREISRINIQDKFVDQNSRTEKRSESSMESIFTTVKIPATYLQKGKNVLTAAICQYSGSDMFFDIKLSLQK